MAHPSVADLRRDKVYEFRCIECGRICWTTLEIGCKTCKSKSLEDFEPYERATAHSIAAIGPFSSLLADAAKRKPRPYQSASDLYQSFKKHCTPLRVAHADELLLASERIAVDFAEGRVSGPQGMVRFESIWNRAAKKVKEEKEQVESIAFQLTTSLLGKVDERAADIQQSYEVEHTFFDTWHVSTFQNVISEKMLDFIPPADHEGIRLYMSGPEASTSRAGYTTRTARNREFYRVLDGHEDYVEHTGLMTKGIVMVGLWSKDLTKRLVKGLFTSTFRLHHGNLSQILDGYCH